MALLKCLEPVTAIGCGLGALALGSLDGGITAGAVIGGSGLIRAFAEARSKHGLDSQTQMDRIRIAIDRSIDRDALDAAGRASLIRADEALARHLVDAVPDRAALGAAAVSLERYPAAACALILERLEGHNAIFRDDAIARDFATQVITASLTEALNNPDYVQLLSPHILTALARGMARVEEGQAEDRVRDEAFQDEQRAVNAELLAISRAVLDRVGNTADTEMLDRIKVEVAKATTDNPAQASANIVEQVVYLIESRQEAREKLEATPVEDNRVRSFQAAAEQALGNDDDAAAIAALLDAEAAIGERQEVDARARANFMSIRAGLLLGQGDWQAADTVWDQAAAMLMPFDVAAGEDIVWEAADRLDDFGQIFGQSPALVASKRRWRALAVAAQARGDGERAAGIQNNLGIVLSVQGERTGGDAGLALLEEAVAAYRAALTVYTQAAMPTDWAMTQNNLGAVLRIQGERTGSDAGLALLEQAVEAYRAALTVRTQAAMPAQWAMTQNNLGIVLKVQGERTGGDAGLALLGEAVAAYRAALTIWTPEHFSHQHEMASKNLALAEALIAARRG